MWKHTTHTNTNTNANTDDCKAYLLHIRYVARYQFTHFRFTTLQPCTWTALSYNTNIEAPRFVSNFPTRVQKRHVTTSRPKLKLRQPFRLYSKVTKSEESKESHYWRQFSEEKSFCSFKKPLWRGVEGILFHRVKLLSVVKQLQKIFTRDASRQIVLLKKYGVEKRLIKSSRMVQAIRNGFMIGNCKIARTSR